VRLYRSSDHCFCPARLRASRMGTGSPGTHLAHLSPTGFIPPRQLSASQHARRNVSVARPLYSRAPRRALPTFASPSPPFLAAVAFDHAALTTWRQRARTTTNRSDHRTARACAQTRGFASVSVRLLSCPPRNTRLQLCWGRGELDPCSADVCPPPYHWSETKTGASIAHSQSCAHVGPDQGRARYIPCLVLE
jgi:hypothetical protein